MMHNATFRRSVSLSCLIIALSSCAHLAPPDKSQDVQKIVAAANAEFFLDQRIWYQDVQAEVKGQQVILTGEAFYPKTVHAINRRLKRAGYDLELIDQVNYLPQKFENDLAYGIVIDPYVMGRFKPVSEKSAANELLYGEPVRLIRDAAPYYQIQSKEGYLSYIPKSSVRPVNLQEWNRYHIGKHAVFGQNVTLENGLSIMIGTRLPHLEEGQLLMADGTVGTVAQEHYRVLDPAANPLRQKVVDSAKQYLDLPYVYAGRSGDGVDCSGLVMQAYVLHDIYLPRDSDEMANTGRIIGLPGWTEAMLPGDLVFFTGNKRLVTHTGIYIGDGMMIHSSTVNGVSLQSLNPESSEYSKSLFDRFVFAKRVFE